MNKALFGRYWPVQSFVHALDPRTKITFAFVMVIVLLLATNWLAMGFSAICVLLFFAASRIPIFEAMRSILPLVFLIVLSALFNLFYVNSGPVLVSFANMQITLGGVDAAIFLSVRLTLLLLMGSLLTMTTTSLDITFGIEEMLSPLTKIKVPIHEFAFVMSTALRFLPQLAEEFDSIRIAQEARGAKLATTPLKGAKAIASLITPMFASVFRHADTLALAMDARCYIPGANRGRLHPAHFGYRDAIAFAVLVFVCVLVAILRLL